MDTTLKLQNASLNEICLEKDNVIHMSQHLLLTCGKRLLNTEKCRHYSALHRTKAAPEMSVFKEAAWVGKNGSIQATQVFIPSKDYSSLLLS